MTPIKEIIALKKGDFEIDCSEIVLTQNTSERPKRYRGPGTIRQDEQGNLVFKIFATSYDNTSPAQEFASFLSAKSGQIYKVEDFYTFAATDYDGRNWVADRVLPYISWHGDGVLVSGASETMSLRGLFLGDQTKEENYLRMHFFTQADIPCTHHKNFGSEITDSNFVAYDALNCHFEISRFADEFVVEVSAADALPPFFDSRILETLQFVLARSLRWRVLVNRTNDGKSYTQFSSPKPTSTTKLEPPIGNMQDRAHYSWSLFARYLEFVTKGSDTQFWHACSGKLHDASEASANSMDAWALGLCVAVEGITNLVTTKMLSNTEKDEIRKLSRLIKMWVRCRKWRPELRDRALGLVSQLNSPRLKDTLAPLAKMGKVRKEYIESWSALRHKRAHGKLVDPNLMTAMEYQEIWSLMNRVTVLLYQVTFYLIGYEGFYTDYGEIGWPKRIYPPGT
jgi:hypothetical protein